EHHRSERERRDHVGLDATDGRRRVGLAHRHHGPRGAVTKQPEAERDGEDDEGAAHDVGVESERVSDAGRDARDDSALFRAREPRTGELREAGHGNDDRAAHSSGASGIASGSFRMVEPADVVHARSMNATAPPEPPAPQAPPHRVLRRDRSNRVLGGVAAGIARTYGVDVVLVRGIWVIAAVFWVGIPAYVIAWI